MPSKKKRPKDDSASSGATAADPASRSEFLLLGAGLVAINVAAYASVAHLGFVDYDDGEYVSANPNIAAGLTWSAIRWAFTTGYFANWHPLTWISHILDVQIFGVNPGGPHVVNLLFHIVNSLLLFGVLATMTGALRRSAFVAALFATHPVHVESVAWISERKDVLSTMFWMLTMWAYLNYVRSQGWRRYSVVAACLALGLMAKPMLVTLPLVLLLLDVWPLRRSLRASLVIEKIPLFALTAASSVVTIMVQRKGGTVMQLGQVPLELRVANALLAYVRYIAKMLWPADLVVMYPLPRELPGVGMLAGAALIMILITVLAVLARRERPYLLVGWLWYIVTLLPVIGIVQVGAQAMADRYTYVPLVGLFIMIAWGIPDWLTALPARRRSLELASALVLIACAALSFRQVQYWRTSLSLWSHAVDAAPENYYAQGSLGYVLWKGGNIDAAIPHYTEALRLRPDFAEGQNNLGVALAGQGRWNEALPHFSEAVRLKPGYAVAQQNLAAATARHDAPDDSLARLAGAVRDKPTDLVARNEYGAALSARGRIDEAIQQFTEALRIDPAQPDLHYNLGMMLDRKGRAHEAAAEFRAALRYNPKHSPAQQALDALLARMARSAP